MSGEGGFDWAQAEAEFLVRRGRRHPCSGDGDEWGKWLPAKASAEAASTRQAQEKWRRRGGEELVAVK